MNVVVELSTNSTQFEIIVASFGPQAQTLARTFGEILTQIIHQREPLQKLDLCSSWDRDQINKWNATELEACLEPVTNILHKNALCNPESLAIESWDCTYTYRELDHASDRLAEKLIKLGVAQKAFVPICFEKSAIAVVSMISILKAGGVFVPLDPSHPASRLRDILGQLDARLILASKTLAEKVACGNVIFIDEKLIESLPPSSYSVASSIGYQDLAYAIFTRYV
jgi:non-ribosomal peptide synthetase component F